MNHSFELDLFNESLYTVNDSFTFLGLLNLNVGLSLLKSLSYSFRRLEMWSMSHLDHFDHPFWSFKVPIHSNRKEKRLEKESQTGLVHQEGE